MRLSLTERIELYRFWASIGFSAAVAFFCMIQLTWHPGSKKMDDQSAYFTLLGTAVSLFINPSGSAKKESNVSVDSAKTTIVSNQE